MTINDQFRYHIGIFQDGLDEVHTFSQFFTDKIGYFCLKNKSKGTIEHFHLTFIIRFLNFIFNDSQTPIEKIEDLTLDMVEEFLDNFSRGTLLNDKINRWRNRETINRAVYSLSYFVYWLWWKKIPNTSKKMFNMKYITIEDFIFTQKNKKLKDGETVVTKVLTPIVIPVMSDKKYTRRKVMNASKYTVSKLIELSVNIDPMITFAIVLGAYAGLRLGDICQMHEGRFMGLDTDNDFGVFLDFTYDAILRSDNIVTSNCKTKRLVPLYEGCTNAIRNYYNEHIRYLKHKGFYPNKYGAIFIDRNGYAMTDRTFERRFRNIEKVYEINLMKEAALGNIDAKKELHLLSNADITIQSLRCYYKQLIDAVEQNSRTTQYYMTHKQLKTGENYGVAAATRENIRKCQNEIYTPLKGGVNDE